MRLSTQIELFLEHKSATSVATTMADVTNCLNRFNRFVAGRRVTKALTSQWYASMFKEELSGGHIDRVQGYVRAMYKWLVENDMLAESPMAPFKKPHYVQKERIPITEADQRRILTWADVHPEDDVWPYAVRCGWHTGLRISDVSRLQWHNILWEERGIRTKPLKTIRFNKEVEIPIQDEFLAFLRKEWIKAGQPATGYVCPRMQANYVALHVQVSDAFVRICEKVGIIGKSFHCYRHGWITRMLARGISAEVISTCTGQTVDQVMEYAHIDLKMKHSIFFSDNQPKQNHDTIIAAIREG